MASLSEIGLDEAPSQAQSSWLRLHRRMMNSVDLLCALRQHVGTIAGMDVSYNDVTDTTFADFIEGIVQIPHVMSRVQCIEAFGNGCGTFTCRSLAKLSKMYPGCGGTQRALDSLLKLKLGENNITAEGTSELVTALPYLPSLVHLHLGLNPLGSIGCFRLCRELSRSCSHQLQVLNLRGCQLEASAMTSLASFVAMSSALSALILGHNDIGDDGLGALFTRGIRYTSTLVELDVSKCGMTSRSCADLVCGITHLRTFRNIDISDNRIDDDGAPSFFDAVRQCNVHIVTARRCGFTRDAGPCIAAMIMATNKLSCLDLAGNRIGSRGASLIAAALCHSSCLMSLSLHDNSIGNSGLKDITHALTRVDTPSTALRHLNMSVNLCGPGSGKHWARILRLNMNLSKLEISDNEMSREDMEDIASALEGNHVLRKFVFGGQRKDRPVANVVTRLVRSRIHDYIGRNHRLHTLHSESFDRDRDDLAVCGVEDTSCSPNQLEPSPVPQLANTLEDDDERDGVNSAHMRSLPPVFAACRERCHRYPFSLFSGNDLCATRTSISHDSQHSTVLCRPSPSHRRTSAIGQIDTWDSHKSECMFFAEPTHEELDALRGVAFAVVRSLNEGDITRSSQASETSASVIAIAQ